jgi:two-component system, OmpR family, phosphate regulon response regulator PhoB
MAKLVIIDDERDILDVLSFNLKANGFEVLCAATGRAGLALILEHRPDAVLLDVMLPDISGTEVCRVVRASPTMKDVPILMISARGEELDRVIGFELGADDYINKPFSVREVTLRIRALMRRNRAPAETRKNQTIEFGVLKMDRDAHRAWVSGQEVILTALEFKLLLTLYERRNRVQTRSALLEHVWGIQAHISTRTVDAHVKRLREKLDAARDYVETVRGVGYRFREDPENAGEGGGFGDPLSTALLTG